LVVRKRVTEPSFSQIGGFVAERKTPWEQASEWFARTLAIVLVMVAPGALGAWLDERVGTNFIAAIGFVLGMVLAIALLMIFVRIRPVHNDGDIMKPRSASSTSQSSTSQTIPQPSPQSTSPKPSESRLPELPGAEVLEAPSDE
jgi:Na+/melibiose symporter-like transporter